MKKFFVVFGCVILALLIAVGVLAYANRSNISSFLTAMKYDDDVIEQEMDKTNEALKTDIDNYFDEGLRGMTEEEEKAIESGEKTKDEVLVEIIAEAPKTQTPTKETIVAKYTSQLLSIKNRYLGQIEAILGSAVAEYHQLPKDQLGYNSKLRIMKKHLTNINSLESSCDAEVENTVVSMEKELKAINADTGIVATVREYYKNEKNLKKAYYMSEYGD